MTRRRVLVLGVIATLAYASTAWVMALWTGRSVPLLDGLAPPPIYRYVETPAGRAPSKPPYSGKFSVGLTTKGSSVYAFTTRDQQVNLILTPGAIPSATGQKVVKFTITPLGPSAFPPAPDGKGVDGNVYHLTATYEPGGHSVETLAHPAHLGLVYPAQATTRKPSHSLLFSSDRSGWTNIHGDDALISQGVRKDITRLGYYAVAGPPIASAGSSPWERWAGIAALTIAVILAVAIFRVGPNKQ